MLKSNLYNTIFQTMMILLWIVTSIIIFSIIVLAHEYGHFKTARIFWVRVEEFWLGIPPRAKKLLTDKKWTLFTLTKTSQRTKSISKPSRTSVRTRRKPIEVWTIWWFWIIHSIMTIKWASPSIPRVPWTASAFLRDRFRKLIYRICTKCSWRIREGCQSKDRWR